MFGFFKRAFYRAKYLTICYRYSIDAMPDEDTELFFDQLDDEVLVIDKTFRGVLKFVAMIPLGFLFIVQTFLAIPKLIETFSFEGDFTTVIIDFMMLSVCIILYLIIVGLNVFVLISPKHYTQRFYRRTGMVEMPKRWLRGWMKGETITFPFCDDAIIPSGGMGTRSLHLTAPGGRSMLLMPANMRKELSFLLWYMDRNRPLPPGKRLDPYRTKDYLRRKAEGFPAPLRKAAIRIPAESVPEEGGV